MIDQLSGPFFLAGKYPYKRDKGVEKDQGSKSKIQPEDKGKQ